MRGFYDEYDKTVDLIETLTNELNNHLRSQQKYFRTTKVDRLLQSICFGYE